MNPRRKESRNLQWWEPVGFNCRSGLRFVQRTRLCATLGRCVIWGALIAAVLHVLFVYVLAVPVPLRVLVICYLGASVFVPGCLCVMLALHMCIPRVVTVTPKKVLIQSGQSATLIPGARLQRWQFACLHNANSDTIVRIWYSHKHARNRRYTIGIARKVDLIRLDRMLRLARRLGNRHPQRTAKAERLG